MGLESQQLPRGETDSPDTRSALRESQQMLAAERQFAEQLQQVATKQISAGGIQEVYENILDALLAIVGAHFASIQMFYPERGSNGELRLLACRGFSEQAAQRWEWVSPATCTTCGEALRTRAKVIVPDVRLCDFMAGTEDLKVYLEAGIRAVQSLPLTSRSGALLGMLSIHWREPHEPSATESRALDVLARLAADLIESSRTEERARDSEERLRFALEAADIGTFDSNLETGITAWTPNLEQMYGLTPGTFEASRAEWLNLIHPEDRNRVELRLRESFETGATTKGEWRVIWPDGSVHWFAARWKVFRNAAGKPVRVRGVNVDITDRKRIEDTVRESEQRFRSIADTAPVMIWVADANNFGTFFNKPWLDFTGRTMEQELGEGWISSVHPDDLEHCVRICSTAFAARRAFQIVFRLRRSDGEYRWILDNGTPRYREGEFTGYIGSCVDITDQKHIEEQLRSKQVQLMDSQRLANVGSWELDIATKQIRCSDQWYRIFGLPRDARADFQTFLSCVHPNDRGIILAAETRAESANAPSWVEFRIIRPGGDMRYIRSVVEPIRNSDGTMVRLAGATQDVTEQVAATERLRESEARLKAAERMTHIGHWTWNLSTNRSTWSEEIFRIMGQPMDYEPDYLRFSEMVVSSDRERLAEWVSGCVREKQGSVIEYHILRPDGEVRTVLCMSEVLLAEDGSPEVLFGTCQDVTEDRRAQQESFARQKLESLGTLASGIAHDFNNLLGAVLAQTELAMAELANGSHPDQELAAIRDLSIRGSEIVRQLMIYAGQESDVPEQVDLSDAVKRMLGLLKVTISRHATLATSLAEDLPAVRIRTAQLSQIVINLIVNASEALEDQAGVVHVTTEHRTISESEASGKALLPGDYVRLEVADTGCGMAPETQARVFDPFFTTKFSGRGLGLAVVHGIVRSLRGDIQVASELGRGTTFEVLLPCIEPERNADENRVFPVEDDAPAAPAATILIVEDEQQLRLAIAKMLRKSGFGVFEVASGSDAIEVLRKRGREVALILLDLTIPGSSSQEVITEASLVNPDVKVILTSAYSDDVARSTVRSTLICGFVRKPFRLADLVQTVRRVLEVKQRSGPAGEGRSTTQRV